MNLKKTTIIRALFFATLALGATSSASWATTYYVSKSGNNSYDGKTASTAFLTIQNALNKVVAGDTVNIDAGTYNEALSLKTTGSKSARITVQNYNGASVTVSSGTSKTITLATSNTIGYYTFSGLNLTATHTNYPVGDDFSVDFRGGSWWGVGRPSDNAPYSELDPQNGGNGCNGFIVQNCNITGAIEFMGHYNTVQNCTMNGQGLWSNGIRCTTVVSHHNTFTNNTITRYTNRGVWAMSNCSYITVTNNDISHWGASANPAAIDFDGATLPDYYCVMQHNTIHDGDGSSSIGMQFENGMYNVCDGNIIYNCCWGMTGINYSNNIGYYNYQIPNNSSVIAAVPSTANGGIGTTMYVTHNIFSNNVVYNTTGAGIELMMTWGDNIYNNTFYNNGSNGAIFLTNNGTSVGTTGVSIINNIISNSPISVNLNAGGSISTETNNLFYGNNSNPYQGSSYLTANPQFKNPSAGIFSLQSTSPAVNAGTAIAAVTTDISGNKRPPYSIGAYELTGVAPSAPTSLTVL